MLYDIWAKETNDTITVQQAYINQGQATEQVSLCFNSLEQNTRDIYNYSI